MIFSGGPGPPYQFHAIPRPRRVGGATGFTALGNDRISVDWLYQPRQRSTAPEARMIFRQDRVLPTNFTPSLDLGASEARMGSLRSGTDRISVDWLYQPRQRSTARRRE